MPQVLAEAKQFRRLGRGNAAERPVNKSNWQVSFGMSEGALPSRCTKPVRASIKVSMFMFIFELDYFSMCQAVAREGEEPGGATVFFNFILIDLLLMHLRTPCKLFGKSIPGAVMRSAINFS